MIPDSRSSLPSTHRFTIAYSASSQGSWWSFGWQRFGTKGPFLCKILRTPRFGSDWRACDVHRRRISLQGSAFKDIRCDRPRRHLLSRIASASSVRELASVLRDGGRCATAGRSVPVIGSIILVALVVTAVTEQWVEATFFLHSDDSWRVSRDSAFQSIPLCSTPTGPSMPWQCLQYGARGGRITLRG